MIFGTLQHATTGATLFWIAILKRTSASLQPVDEIAFLVAGAARRTPKRQPETPLLEEPQMADWQRVQNGPNGVQGGPKVAQNGTDA